MMWERDISGECPDVDEGNVTITNGSTNYNITELEAGSNYIIAVIATNVAGSAISDSVILMTREACMFSTAVSV